MVPSRLCVVIKCFNARRAHFEQNQRRRREEEKKQKTEEESEDDKKEDELACDNFYHTWNLYFFSIWTHTWVPISTYFF